MSGLQLIGEEVTRILEGLHVQEEARQADQGACDRLVHGPHMVSPATLTVDLARTREKHSTWHIVALPDRQRTLCNLDLSAREFEREGKLDAHVVSHRGARVCGVCRRKLH